jgi:hypothetical protein
LSARHGRALCHVLCAARDLANDEPGLRIEVGGDANIDYDDACTRLPCQHVDGCAAATKVQYHLRRHCRGIRAHAFDRHTVISSHDDDGLARDRGSGPAGDCRKLDR